MATKKEEEIFHSLESEDEFDRFMTATVQTIGTALLQDPNREREDVDEIAELTFNNIMFLCQEYHALVAEGKIAPMPIPKDLTKEQARREVLEQLRAVEAFFSTAKVKQEEEDETDRDKS